MDDEEDDEEDQWEDGAEDILEKGEEPDLFRDTTETHTRQQIQPNSCCLGGCFL